MKKCILIIALSLTLLPAETICMMRAMQRMYKQFMKTFYPEKTIQPAEESPAMQEQAERLDILKQKEVARKIILEQKQEEYTQKQEANKRREKAQKTFTQGLANLDIKKIKKGLE